MNILHVITGLSNGGAEGILFNLCTHDKNNKHIVISLMDEGDFGSSLRDKNVKVHCLRMNRGKPSIFKFFKLMCLIRSEHPDVVQTWMYHSDLLGGMAARMAGVRRVFWGIRHSTLDKGKAKRSTIMIARVCALLSSWVPEKIICCANKALTVHEALGYAKDKLLVIPNGYDLNRLIPNKASGLKVRVELGIKEREFVIGNVGRYDPIKDHENLLSALSLVNKAGINFSCLLVGRGLEAKNQTLISRINALGLQDRMLLAGQRTDIPAIMNALDLHVLASFSEGFPNVLAEAMACGTPCVSTNVGDALEIIGDPQLTCPAQDPLALAQLIQNMYQQWANQAQEWKQREIDCPQRITELFSLQSMIEAYEDCWSGRKN